MADRLLSLGAQQFIGFTESPTWQTSDGARLWSRFDVDLFCEVALGRSATDFLANIDRAMELAQYQLGLYDEFDTDIYDFVRVLGVMLVTE